VNAKGKSSLEMVSKREQNPIKARTSKMELEDERTIFNSGLFRHKNRYEESL